MSLTREPTLEEIHASLKCPEEWWAPSEVVPDTELLLLPNSGGTVLYRRGETIRIVDNLTDAVCSELNAYFGGADAAALRQVLQPRHPSC